MLKTTFSTRCRSPSDIICVNDRRAEIGGREWVGAVSSALVGGVG